MKFNNTQRKKKQLSHFVKRLDYLLRHPEGKRELIEKLVYRIRGLIFELRMALTRRELKRVLGATAIIIGISAVSTNQVQAQSFAAPVTNPFNLDSVAYYSMPAFADLDGDGDMDLLVGEYEGSMQYFENIGTPSSPSFDTPQKLPFGLTPAYYFAFPTFADLDGDGDTDLLVGEYYGTLQYYQNMGDANNPIFAAPIENPFGLDSADYIAFPDLADLDGDGDFDLMVGEDYGNHRYFENIGSPTAPQFAAPVLNPFGLIATGGAMPKFSDMDEDGDLDILSGSYYGNMIYFENLGSKTNPVFAAPVVNPFGLVPTETFAYPAFADLDDDGDTDMLAGEYYGAMQYFENVTQVGVADNQFEESLLLFPNPVTDKLNIRTDESIELVEIFDATGKMVLEERQGNNSIDLSQLRSGLYHARIRLENGTFVTRKLLKN